MVKLLFMLMEDVTTPQSNFGFFKLWISVTFNAGLFANPHTCSYKQTELPTRKGGSANDMENPVYDLLTTNSEESKQSTANSGA